MKSTKRLALFLVFVVLLTSLQSCSMPVKHYSQSNAYNGFAYCTTVEYDNHVEYGEVINFNICIAKTYWPGCFSGPGPVQDDATISIKDGDFYEVVGQSEYTYTDFSKGYSIGYDRSHKKDAYKISLDFSIKITEPSYNLETLYVDLDYYIFSFEKSEANDGSGEYIDKPSNVQFPVIKYISDDNGVTVYYYTGLFGYRNIKSK